MNKVYFSEGDIVVINKPLPNAPIMLVNKVIKASTSAEGTPLLIGIECIWFTTTNEIQKFVFSSKDLKHATEPSVKPV